MKFLHVSDLHLDKMIHGVSMLENGDQPVWIDRFLALAEDQRPDAVLIAGDVYDRGSPSAAAVEQLSRLVEGLAALNIHVMLTAGNHDSGQRLAFARELLARQNVHIAGTVDKELIHVTLRDEFGPVTFWLMPYVFPALIAKKLEDDTIRDYDTAVRRLLDTQKIDPNVRHVLIAHQNVTANGTDAVRGGSESTVGGVGQVDFSAFDAFDYVALGHIHAAYQVGRETVRYAGSPMCYHFNETRQAEKGPVLVELGAKGNKARIETLRIPPLHPMRELRGTLDELRGAELARESRNEYLRLVITDQPMTPEINDFFQALAESRGSVLMERISEYRQFSSLLSTPDIDAVQERTLEELFADFYSERCGGGMPDTADTELLGVAGELLRNTPADPRQRYAVDSVLTDQLLAFLIKQEEDRA